MLNFIEYMHIQIFKLDHLMWRLRKISLILLKLILKYVKKEFGFSYEKLIGLN
jgi:hypothetical protein